jgi:hypothetical protein
MPYRSPLPIRYDQFDIEKVSAPPDVPDSFAYSFVPLGSLDHPQHSIAHLGNFQA